MTRSFHRKTAKDSACTAQILHIHLQYFTRVCIQIICIYNIFILLTLCYSLTPGFGPSKFYPSDNLSVTSSKPHPLLRTWNEALPVYKARWAKFGGLTLPLADLNITWFSSKVCTTVHRPDAQPLSEHAGSRSWALQNLNSHAPSDRAGQTLP